MLTSMPPDLQNWRCTTFMFSVFSQPMLYCFMEIKTTQRSKVDHHQLHHRPPKYKFWPLGGIGLPTDTDSSWLLLIDQTETKLKLGLLTDSLTTVISREAGPSKSNSLEPLQLFMISLISWKAFWLVLVRFRKAGKWTFMCPSGEGKCHFW